MLYYQKVIFVAMRNGGYRLLLIFSTCVVLLLA